MPALPDCRPPAHRIARSVALGTAFVLVVVILGTVSPGGAGAQAPTPSSTAAPTVSADPTAAPPSATAAPSTTAEATPGTRAKSNSRVRAQATALSCQIGTVYGVNNGNIFSINTATGAAASVATTLAANTSPNALAVQTGGAGAIYLQNGTFSAGFAPTLYLYDPATGATTTTPGAPLLNGLAGFVRGGFNLSNGFYYYSGPRSSDPTINDFYAYDTRTSTAVGYVGSVSSPTDSSSNGDLAFDAYGNLVVAIADGDTQNFLYRVPAFPTTVRPANTTLSRALLTSLPNGIVPNGITFDNDGFLYVSTATLLYKLNPNTGAVQSGYPKTVAPPGGNSMVDLADCENPGTVLGEVDLPGRFTPTDQFRVTITGGGVSSGNSGTTTGTDTGLQALPSEVAGPILGVPGTTYTLTQTATSGSLTNYTTAVGCVDTTNDDAAVTLTPTGTSGVYTLSFPAAASTGGTLANIRCTFTNTPLAPAVTLTKTASRTTTSTPGDVTTYTYVAINTGNTPLTAVAISDPQAGLSALSCTPTAPAALAAGNRLTCTATRTTTQADLTVGTALTNTGTVRATTPAGATLTRTATATVTPVQTPALDLVATPSTTTFTAPGQTITYTLTATNTGNVPLTAVGVTDSKTGLSALSCSPTRPAALAPGAVLTCTATYVTIQTDVDNGSTGNTATATGKPPTGANVTDTATVTTTGPTRTPAIQLSESAPATVSAVGQVVTYGFTIANTGNVTLTGLALTDSLAGLGTITCTPVALGGSLAPGTSTGCQARRSTTQADLDAGSVVDAATVTGSSPTGVTPATVSSTSSAPVSATQDPSLAVTSTPSRATFTAPGQTITYTLVLTNTGNVTLTEADLTDSLVGLSALTCDPSAPARLAPGGTLTCQATYVTTQADLDAGRIDARATGSVTTPTGAVLEEGANSSVTVNQTSRVDVTTSASSTSVTAAGTQVTYTFTGHNSGNTTLTDVAVANTLPGLSALDCVPAQPMTLAPDASFTCTAVYTTTQADLDGAGFTNTATITALAPGNTRITDAQVSTVTTPDSPTISLDKSVDPDAVDAAGDVVTYTYVATNTGNVSLADVVVTDPQARLSPLACTPAAPAALLPGATLTCTATYAAVQADVDAGGFDTTATATGNPPADDAVTATDNAPVTAAGEPGISLDKSVDPDAVGAAGEVVTYTYVATNTGNVSLADVVVTDPQAGLSPFTCTPAAPASLAPGATLTCTATYAAAQADVDAGGFDTTATATGNPPADDAVTATDDAPVAAAETPDLLLEKTVDQPTLTNAADEVTYTYVATNTGNVSLTGVRIVDPQPRLAPLTCLPAAPATVAPGANLTCTATYAATQADVDAGGFNSIATATGTSPSETAVSDTDDEPVTAAAGPSVSIVTTTDPDAVDTAGEVVTYTVVATNTGNVTLTGVVVADPHVGLSALSCSAAPPATLAPGESLTCTATYVVAQTDIDAGSIVDSATVTATPPGGPAITEASTVTITVPPVARINLDLTADPGTVDDVGDGITYTFVATNTGNVTLTGVAIADPLPGLGELTCTPGTPATLAPGGTVRCTAAYAATQNDIDTGRIVNPASVTGAPPTGTAVGDTDSVSVSVPPAPRIRLTKDADPTVVQGAGDVVTYTFTGINNGNVSLTDVQVADPYPGLSALDCTPALGSTLVSGQSISCTATYTATQDNADVGRIENVATITGTPPTGDDVTDDDGALVTIGAGPAIELVKTADRTDAAVGEEIGYTFVATNAGNVTLTDVVITDPLVGLSALSCGATAPVSLAPRSRLTCTATYTLTQEDLDRGQVINTAGVTGDPPAGDPVGDDDAHVLTLGQRPSFGFTKTADTDSVRVGDTITFTLVGTNTGNVTLTDVQVDDPLPGLSQPSCDPVQPAVLAPGATITCTATYEATAADGRRGELTNSASVTGTAPGGAATEPVSVALDAEVTVVVKRVPGTSTLPNTGGVGLIWLGLALGLSLAGGVAIRTSRRRRAR